MSKRGASENVSVVYFALDREAMLMKVGRTEDEGKRRTSLQTGNGRTFEWLGSIPGGEAEERNLHAALVAWDPTCRARGEWFRVTEELVERVRAIVEDHERATLTAQLEASVARIRSGTPWLEVSHAAH